MGELSRKRCLIHPDVGAGGLVKMDIESLYNVFYSEDTGVCEKEAKVSSACTGCGFDDGTFYNVCCRCGLVSKWEISEGADWVSGVTDDGVANDNSRVGMASNPLFSENYGKSTFIKTNYKNRKTHGLISRINWHHSTDHRDRALGKAYSDFDKAGEFLSLTKGIMDTAKTYYKKFSQEKLTRGRVRDGIKANCLFWACKSVNAPRTTEEIATAFGIETRDVTRTYDLARGIINPATNTITRPADVVPRIFNSLDMCVDKKLKVLMMNCKKVAELLRSQPKLMGKTPSAVAAVIIYRVLFNTDYEVCKEDVSEAAGVSVATINKIDSIVKVLLPK